MLEEPGLVVEVFDQYAIIQIKPSNMCGHCTAHCGATGLTTKKSALVKATNHQGAMVGDEVIIGLEEKVLLKNTATVYLLPLLGMFAFVTGYHLLAAITPLPDSEVFTVLASLIGFVVGLRFAQQALLKHSSWSPFWQSEKLNRSKNTGSQPVVLTGIGN